MPAHRTPSRPRRGERGPRSRPSCARRPGRQQGGTPAVCWHLGSGEHGDAASVTSGISLDVMHACAAVSSRRISSMHFWNRQLQSALPVVELRLLFLCTLHARCCAVSACVPMQLVYSIHCLCGAAWSVAAIGAVARSAVAVLRAPAVRSLYFAARRQPGPAGGCAARPRWSADGFALVRCAWRPRPLYRVDAHLAVHQLPRFLAGFPVGLLRIRSTPAMRRWGQ